MIFHTAGINEKKNIFIMNNEKKKKFGAESFLGYCPNYIVKKENCIVRGRFVLQEVCSRLGVALQ